MSLFREAKDCLKFFKLDKKSRRLAFYSENRIYYKYYEGFIDSILDNSDLDICYITSDIHDHIFNHPNKRIKTFYVNKLLAFFLAFLDSKVMVMTMPDLNQFHLKRSTNNVNYVYVFHAIMSSHMAYRKGAFDYYDTIFCVGRHHTDEILETEEISKLKPKKLVEVGYPLLEKLHQDYQDYLQKTAKDPKPDKKIILLAPSWNENNIMETCAEEIVARLLEADYKVIVRPHPEFVKRKGQIVEEIAKKFAGQKDFELELNLISNESFYKADVLITDWSGIAFEFSFGTERPVMFIDTPRKVHNPEYQRLTNEPLEVKSRSFLGKVISPQEIASIAKEINEIMINKEKYHQDIINFRKEFIYNWGKSSDVGAQQIIDLVNDK